jgi:outer membrane cobalamin receptor
MHAVRYRRWRVAAGFWAASALCLHLVPAWAQSASPSQADTGSNGALQTVVVTATRILSPGVSASGTNDYAITSENIADLPAGDNTVLTDVLAQMPGVGIDQNQQVHIRNTEGSGFQYQIDGVLVPLDIITNPPFISMINPLFIKRFDLLDGILPAQYSYSTGGVLDIQTKDGCEQPGGSASLFAGQRDMLQPSAQYGGCDGAFSYYASALYSQSNLAFSSATPGDDPIHDRTQQGQAFGVFSYALDATTRLKLILSTAVNDNQLPNVPGLAPQFALANAPAISSAQINSYLNFRDYLGILSLSGAPSPALSYQIAYTLHSIAELYQPDNAGELLYQGVASQATHQDLDHTLQGDLNFRIGAHKLSTGFYLGAYNVTADGSSLVFPADANGVQTSDVPLHIVNNIQSTNVLSGIYLNDLWQISPAWRTNLGVRWDDLTGFSPGNQFSPNFNLSYMPFTGTTFHAGTARYFQVPSFEGISPSAPAAFANTTGAGPPGSTLPLTEHDWEWDAGIVQTLRPGLTISEDNFFEKTWHYLDAGQFGAVPVFAPFNYDHGEIWGAEIALDYNADKFSAYTNFTAGRNIETGVVTGQFNFDAPGELQYIDSHYIVLDHQPLLTISSGGSYEWNHYKILLDAIFNTGLRTGFANLQSLPDVFQVNFGVRRSFQIGTHVISNQLTLWNIFDRVNLIRPSGGLGVFQSAYGARFTILDAITISL